MLTKRLAIFAFVLLLFTVSPKSFSLSEDCSLDEAKKIRTSAFKLHQKGWNGLAVQRSKQAIQMASQCEGINTELIESYDDTALYFFLIDDYAKSAYYQLIATALSENSKLLGDKSALYKRRLGWALNKYSKDIGCASNQCSATMLVCYNFLGVKNEFAVAKNIKFSSAKCSSYE